MSSFLGTIEQHNPVLAYRCDDKGSTIKDLAGMNDLSVGADVTVNQDPLIVPGGRSIRVSGANGASRSGILGGVAAQLDQTVIAFFRADASATGRDWALGLRVDVNNFIGINVLISTGTVEMGHVVGGVDRGRSTAASSISPNTTYMVANSINPGGTPTIYLNGSLVANSGTNSLANHFSDNEIELGFRSNDVNQFFNGQIDQVYIINSALTTEQIAEIWNASQNSDLPYQSLKASKYIGQELAIGLT